MENGDPAAPALLLNIKELDEEGRRRVIEALAEVLGSLKLILQEIPLDELKSRLLIHSPPWSADMTRHGLALPRPSRS